MNINYGEPVFNSALAYLERIDKLKRSFHEFSINGEWEQMYYSISELQSEIIPRLRKFEMKKAENELMDHSKSCETILLNPPTNKMQELMYKKKLMTWFIDLGTIIHKQGLEMPEKENGLGAEDII